MEVTSPASLWVEPDAPATPRSWPALELIDVFRIFRAGDTETVALRGLDMRVEAGEVVAVLGPSGCGKSTMLALAAGLDQPSAGEVRASGTSLARIGQDELAAWRANDIAIVFQGNNLWPAMTARENVETGLRIAGMDRVRERADSALAQFGLAGRERQRANSLSGGEQQRVAIAAAAARSAGLVLADEPTGELDGENERIVMDALLALRDTVGSTVVIVTHSAVVASRADRIIELRDGRAVT